MAWVWFAIIVTIYSLAVTKQDFFYNYKNVQGTVIGLFTLSMAVTAAGSFRRERETGVLELLLVAPLGVRQIINGRLLGLWAQFLPALATLLVIWAYLGMPFAYQNSYSPTKIDLELVISFLTSALAIPVAGLYFSVQCRTLIVAVIMTAVAAYLVPLVGAAGGDYLMWAYDVAGPQGRVWRHAGGSFPFFQILVAFILYLRLRQKLERRQFPLTRP